MTWRSCGVNNTVHVKIHFEIHDFLSTCAYFASVPNFPFSHPNDCQFQVQILRVDVLNGSGRYRFSAALIVTLQFILRNFTNETKKRSRESKLLVRHLKVYRNSVHSGYTHETYEQRRKRYSYPWCSDPRNADGISRPLRTRTNTEIWALRRAEVEQRKISTIAHSE